MINKITQTHLESIAIIQNLQRSHMLQRNNLEIIFLNMIQTANSTRKRITVFVILRNMSTIGASFFLNDSFMPIVCTAIILLSGYDHPNHVELHQTSPNHCKKMQDDMILSLLISLGHLGKNSYLTNFHYPHSNFSNYYPKQATILQKFFCCIDAFM